MQPVSRSTQTAYKWGEGGVGWPLVDTDGLLVVEETMAPGFSEKRHHHKATQCFYILEGTALMKIDGQNIVFVQGMACTFNRELTMPLPMRAPMKSGFW